MGRKRLSGFRSLMKSSPKGVHGKEQVHFTKTERGCTNRFIFVLVELKPDVKQSVAYLSLAFNSTPDGDTD